MRRAFKHLAMAMAILACASAASAQTADEIIEKSIAALGGRDAMMKLKSRVSIGDMTLQTPAGDIPATIQVTVAAPNKSRSLIQADLSSLGAGQLVIDNRFDGTAGYALNSLQGNSDITGNQLDNLKNQSFPHPFLNYKAQGTTVKLVGKDKVGARDVFALTFEPTTGSTSHTFIDAETYLPIRSSSKVNIPQAGGDIEQTSDFSDYRAVDGMKVPFKISVSSSVQSYAIAFSKVEHNTTIDDKQFSKPQ
jgi:hypothetical protein